PLARWMRGDADVHDLAPLEGDQDERIENLEADRDHREEVASPHLREMVLEERLPLLTSPSLQIQRSVLGDRPWRGLPAKLREFARDPVSPPQRVLLPKAPDEGSKLGINRRAPDGTPRAVPPPEPPSGSMPANDRRGSDDHDGVEQRPRAMDKPRK